MMTERFSVEEHTADLIQNDQATYPHDHDEQDSPYRFKDSAFNALGDVGSVCVHGGILR